MSSNPSTAGGNLFAAFRKAFRPACPALTTPAGSVYTYADLEAESARLARYLGARGVRPGDRVSVQVEKSPEALLLYLACLRGGFVYHPLNPGYRADELRFFIEDAEPALVVCDRSGRALFEELGVARLETLDSAGRGSLWEASRATEADGDVAPAEPGTLAALLYSSGTTGRPKGVMLTHGNLHSNMETLVAAWGFTAEDRLLHALPIYHVHGLFVAAGCTLLSGGEMRWLPRFNAAEVIRELPACTAMMGVPTYYTRLLAEPGFTAETCAGIRLFTSGSAPLLPETFERFEQRTGRRILERYGMTETGMNASNPLDGERRPGTVGPPLPGVELRVVDSDGRERPAGEIGDLEVRGPNVFAGYWRMPDKTAEEFTADGFFRTGDQARIDSDGYVSIVGRSKDMVISGGLNVYPKEVELALDRLEGVRESAVFGVPHPDLGEAVAAAVVLEPDVECDEAALVAELKRRIAGFKVPKRIVAITELPRNAMAKVQKSVLRERYRDLLSGGS